MVRTRESDAAIAAAMRSSATGAGRPFSPEFEFGVATGQKMAQDRHVLAEAKRSASFWKFMAVLLGTTAIGGAFGMHWYETHNNNQEKVFQNNGTTPTQEVQAPEQFGQRFAPPAPVVLPPAPAVPPAAPTVAPVPPQVPVPPPSPEPKKPRWDPLDPKRMLEQTLPDVRIETPPGPNYGDPNVVSKKISSTIPDVQPDPPKPAVERKEPIKMVVVNGTFAQPQKPAPKPAVPARSATIKPTTLPLEVALPDYDDSTPTGGSTVYVQVPPEPTGWDVVDGFFDHVTRTGGKSASALRAVRNNHGELQGMQTDKQRHKTTRAWLRASEENAGLSGLRAKKAREKLEKEP